MIPLDNLVAVQETSGPQVINHYNIFRSAEIDGSPAPGISSGQGLEKIWLFPTLGVSPFLNTATSRAIFGS